MQNQAHTREFCGNSTGPQESANAEKRMGTKEDGGRFQARNAPGCAGDCGKKIDSLNGKECILLQGGML
jgi:hypothetical protein